MRYKTVKFGELVLKRNDDDQDYYSCTYSSNMEVGIIRTRQFGYRSSRVDAQYCRYGWRPFIVKNGSRIVGEFTEARYCVLGWLDQLIQRNL